MKRKRKYHRAPKPRALKHVQDVEVLEGQGRTYGEQILHERFKGKSPNVCMSREKLERLLTEAHSDGSKERMKWHEEVTKKLREDLEAANANLAATRRNLAVMRQDNRINKELAMRLLNEKEEPY